MPYRRFAMFNVIGAIAWVPGMTLTGYFLGKAIPGIESKIEWVIAIVIFISVTPLIYKYLKHKRDQRKAAANGAAVGTTPES
jgi:membrane-associated protein